MKRVAFAILCLIILMGCRNISPHPSSSEPSSSPNDSQQVPKNEEPPAEPQTQPPESSPQDTVNNEMVVGDTSITPKEISIKSDEELTFRVEGSKRHKMACYLGPSRVVLSEDLREGQTFSYLFNKEGDYVCIDIIYGLRSTVHVGISEKGSSITGRFVNDQMMMERVFFLAPVTLVAIIAIVSFVVTRKRS